MRNPLTPFDNLPQLLGRDLLSAIHLQDQITRQLGGIDRRFYDDRNSMARSFGLDNFALGANDLLRKNRDAATAVGLLPITAAHFAKDIRDSVGLDRISGFARDAFEESLEPYAWMDSLSTLAGEWRDHSALASSFAMGQLGAEKLLDNPLNQALAQVASLRDWVSASAVADAHRVGRTASDLSAYHRQIDDMLGVVNFDGLQSRMLEIENRLAKDLVQYDMFSLGVNYSGVENMDLSWLRELVEDGIEEAVNDKGTDLEPRKLYQLKLWLGRHLTKRLLVQMLGMSIDLANLNVNVRLLNLATAERTEVAPPQVPTLSFKNSDLRVVSGDSVRLRVGPSTTQRVITTMAKGQLVKKLKTKREWVLVQVIDLTSDGVSYTGWTHGKYLKFAHTDTMEMLFASMWSAAENKTGRSNQN